MIIERSLLPELQEINQIRLKDLLKKEKDVLFHDIDGFILGKNAKQNAQMIRLLSQHLQQNLFIAAVTGRGEPAYAHYAEPLQKLLEGKVNLNLVPSYICPFNGALVQHTFSREVIYDLPIEDDLYEAITSHELVQAARRLTVHDDYKKTTSSDELIQKGYIDPRSVENPGIRHNWSIQQQKRYQLSLVYNTAGIDFQNNRNAADLEIIQHYCQGIIPEGPESFAPYLHQALAESGTEVSTTTALGFTVVDIAHPDVSKQLAFEKLYPFMVAYTGRDFNDFEGIKTCGVGGGDSPLYNDAPLMNMFTDAITNNQQYWQHYSEDGPIILDFPALKGNIDQIEQTRQFLTQLNKLDLTHLLDNLN